MLYGVTTSFFFNDTATTEIYTLSLHDALPILFLEAEFLSASEAEGGASQASVSVTIYPDRYLPTVHGDRKSTRLNSSHSQISYAVFCLKKKNNNILAIDREILSHDVLYARRSD